MEEDLNIVKNRVVKKLIILLDAQSRLECTNLNDFLELAINDVQQDINKIYYRLRRDTRGD